MIIAALSSVRQTGIKRGGCIFHKEEIEKILEQAQRMDPQLEIFSVSEHQYKPKPPLDLAFVRAIEEKEKLN